jgi:hypothetical protein
MPATKDPSLKSQSMAERSQGVVCCKVLGSQAKKKKMTMKEKETMAARLGPGLSSSRAKTYNGRDSQMVTHSSTSRPVQCLCMAERTGCPVLA